MQKQNTNVGLLSIPGYDILFPKSWDKYGFARVLVYVKKSFRFEQIYELENDVVQSIWLRGSYQNNKKIYFSHGYREHSSVMGSSINDIFLQQWEDALNHCQPTEPNEVHVSLIVQKR